MSTHLRHVIGWLISTAVAVVIIATSGTAHASSPSTAITRTAAVTVTGGHQQFEAGDGATVRALPAAVPVPVQLGPGVTGVWESPGCGHVLVVSAMCRHTFGTANDVIHGKLVKAAGDFLGGNGATAERLYHAADCVTSGLDCLAKAIADAAGASFRWLWRNIDTATSIDLVPLFHPFTGGGQSLMDVTIEIAALLGLGLFLFQLTLSALRGEPGGAGRAVRGLLTAYLGSVVAILAIPLLDAAITEVCDGIVRAVTHHGLSGFGKTLATAMSLAGVAGIGMPVVLILIGAAIIVSTVIIWGAMMLRKMLVVVAAIFAPIAFSGATADSTQGWVRRWIEFTVAMLFSKLVLVIWMTVAFMFMDGYGSHRGITNSMTNVCIGVLMLAVGGFAPLIAIKMVHFAGDGLHHLHAQSTAVRRGASTVVFAPQKISSLRTAPGMRKTAHNAPTAFKARLTGSTANRGPTPSTPNGTASTGADSTTPPASPHRSRGWSAKNTPTSTTRPPSSPPSSAPSPTTEQRSPTRRPDHPDSTTRPEGQS